MSNAKDNYHMNDINSSVIMHHIKESRRTKYCGAEIRVRDAFKNKKINAAKRSRQHARIQRKDTHKGGTHPKCNPTNGHTYFQIGGDAPTMKPNEWTHIFSQGGDAPKM